MSIPMHVRALVDDRVYVTDTLQQEERIKKEAEKEQKIRTLAQEKAKKAQAAVDQGKAAENKLKDAAVTPVCIHI